MSLKNDRVSLLCYFKFLHHFLAIGEFKLGLQSGNAQSGSNSTIFRAMWPWNLTFKTNRSPLLCYFKLCASFCSHWWIQTGVKSPETPNLGQIWRFLEPRDLEIWPSKPIGHLFYATSSFAHHSVTIVEFKLELQSGSAQSGSNLTTFRAVWPWNLTDDLEKQ